MSEQAIHGLMAKTLKDIGTVGKGGWNAQQGFAFRAIEDVMNTVHDAMANNGILFLPQVQERITGERETSNKKTLYVVNLRMRFTFIAPDGSFVYAETWGEGTDSGDKATNKAMSAALKYALMHTFCIPTKDIEDGDSSSPEETMPKTRNIAPRPTVPPPTPETTRSSPVPSADVSTAPPAPVAENGQEDPRVTAINLRRIIPTLPGFVPTIHRDRLGVIGKFDLEALRALETEIDLLHLKESTKALSGYDETLHGPILESDDQEAIMTLLNSLRAQAVAS